MLWGLREGGGRLVLENEQTGLLSLEPEVGAAGER